MVINYKLFRTLALVCLIGSIFGAILLADGGSAEAGVVLLIAFGAFFVVLLDWLFAKLFERAAVMKGYSGREYFWLCFWLGFIAYLAVIALPDMNAAGKSSVAKELPESLPEL